MSYNCLNILKWTEAQLKYTYDVSLQEATPQELHEALGDAVMMAISDNWNRSKRTRMHQRKAYYFSAEYLIGRLVYSNLYNLGILDEMKQLFAERGVDLAILEDIEDAALGNGGLGRLAACFLDSAASTDMPLDNAAMQLVRNPKQFDVMLCSNIFGDILSDEASQVAGSIGMLASASLGEGKRGLYEPIHGSAPDIAGKGIANPLATILSVAMMLRYSMDEMEAADAIEKAVEKVLEDGYRTPDIYTDGCRKVGTVEMGDAVVAALA